MDEEWNKILNEKRITTSVVAERRLQEEDRIGTCESTRTASNALQNHNETSKSVPALLPLSPPPVLGCPPTHAHPLHGSHIPVHVSIRNGKS